MTVLSVTRGVTPAEVILTTSPQMFREVYTLNIRGVQDLRGHQLDGSNGQKAFLSTTVIDGDFSDWAYNKPNYTNAQGLATAADYKSVAVYNDDEYIYVHVELWEPNDLFSTLCSMFFDTDNNPATGSASRHGSELLLQGTNAFYLKHDALNPLKIYNIDYTRASGPDGKNFEYRLSRAATFADGTPVFPTNIIHFHFISQSLQGQIVNYMPLEGTLARTIGVVHSHVPPGPLVPSSHVGMQKKINWTGGGRLQSRDSLSTGSWADVPASASPYSIPLSGAQRYYRLVR